MDERSAGVGELIRERRKAEKMTRNELAIAIGNGDDYSYNTTMIYQWENDIRPVPVWYLRPLARILHLSVEDLVP